MDREKITREAAKERIDEAQFGYIVITDLEPKEAIGHVPDEELEHEPNVESYRFGDGVEDLK